MSKLYRVAAGAFAVALIASAAHADGPDISAQRCLRVGRVKTPA